MKYDMTPDDLKKVAFDSANDRVLKHLRDLAFYKFSIGDVLIKEEKRFNPGSGPSIWQVSMAGCNLPYKYVYIYENDLGVGYIRRLSVNGRSFVDRVTCVTEFDPDYTRFKLDPEYADHLLLSSEDENFDTKTRYDAIKNKREQIKRKNQKLKVKMTNEAEAVEWMKTLKVGDQVWFGYRIGAINKEVYSVYSVTFNTGAALTPSTKVCLQAGSYKAFLDPKTLTRYCVFMQKPFFAEDVID